MAAIVEDGKLRLSGYVGDYYYDDGFTASDVVLALAEVEAGSELAVHINSPGGVASEGAAIHALLVARSGVTNVVVEGIAASAASLIAMAGASVTMSAGAIMMIHDPSGITVGTSDDHAKSIEGLEAIATAYARVYADKSGKTADECREIMKAETWFTPQQAVDAGFADSTTEKAGQAVAAFDYRVFAHAPQELRKLAKQKNWSLPAAKHPAEPADPPSPSKDTPMTDKERADQLAADNAKLKADLDSAGKTAIATAADIVDICTAAGVPTMASALIRECVTLEQAKARTSNVKDIRAAVDLANKMNPKLAAKADDFISAGLTMDQVRAKLFEQITAAQSPEITSAHQANTGEADDAKAEADKVVALHRGVANSNSKQGSAA